MYAYDDMCIYIYICIHITTCLDVRGFPANLGRLALPAEAEHPALAENLGLQDTYIYIYIYIYIHMYMYMYIY